MPKLLNLGLLVVVFAIMSVTARHVSKDSKSVRCRDSVSMIGDIPHPRNCFKFYTCAPAGPESEEPTIPIEMDCPSDLYYNFRKCECDYGNSGCFDGMVDNAVLFICAKPYDPSEHTDKLTQS